MKKIASAVVLFSLLSIPVVASNRRAPERRFPRAGAKVEVQKVERSAEWVKGLLSQARDSVGGVGASAIITNRSARQLVIPSAGSVRGANDTFYRSDITFVNYSDSDQDVATIWFPNGGDGAFELAVVTIPGDAPPSTIEDFVGEALGLSGLGSLVFLPVIDDELDEDAAIDIYSRIWSPQPNASGIVSFPFPAVDLNHLQGEYEAIILGLRQDAAHRTNYGIVNMSEDDDVRFRVWVYTEDGLVADVDVVDLPAGSMIQRSLPAGDYGNFSLLISVEEEVPGDTHIWTAYASSNNNISNDGWVSIAAQAWDDDDLDTASLPR